MTAPELVGFTIELAKGANTGRYVRGWASVALEKGRPVRDHDGHVIEMAALRAAAHEFITTQRVAKAMHAGAEIGTVVESVLVDDEFVKALGATTPFRGWWIGMEVHDETVRKKVVSGEFKAFSIGGRGRVRP